MVRHRQEFSRIVDAILNQPLDNQFLEFQHSTLWEQHSGAFTRGPQQLAAELFGYRLVHGHFPNRFYRYAALHPHGFGATS